MSGKRIARLLRQTGLHGVSRRRRYGTTQKDPAARPHEDLVERNFCAPGPDRLWVSDITFVRTRAGFLFLAVVLDAWSRKIVGWSMANHLRAELVTDALDMAIYQRRPDGVICHSDQGESIHLARGRQSHTCGTARCRKKEAPASLCRRGAGTLCRRPSRSPPPSAWQRRVRRRGCRTAPDRWHP